MGYCDRDRRHVSKKVTRSVLRYKASPTGNWISNTDTHDLDLVAQFQFLMEEALRHRLETQGV